MTGQYWGTSNGAGNWLGANPTGLVVNESRDLDAGDLTCWKSAAFALQLDWKTRDCTVAGLTVVKASPTAIRDDGTNNLIGAVTHVDFPAATACPASVTAFVGESVTLSGGVTGGVAPFAYLWSPGDATADLPGASVAHAYATAGDYTATLTVTDAEGDLSQDTVQVHVVVDTQPTASATASNSTPVTGQSVTFTATATGGNAPLTYAWDWGDETAVGSGETATHAYATAGTYTVTLTVTDADGDATTATLTITVAAPASTGADEPDGGDGDRDIGSSTSGFFFLAGGIVSVGIILHKTKSKYN